MPDAPLTAEDFIEQAFELVSNVLGGGSDPEMFALFTDNFIAAQGAAQGVTFADIVREHGIRLPVSTSPVDAAAVRFAEKEAARLVAQVSQTTREGLARVVAEGLRDLASVPQAARPARAQLLANDMGKNLGRASGLNSQRVATLQNYEKGLRDSGLWTEGQIQSKLDLKASSELNKRSRLIANTEMNFAVSEAAKQQAEKFGAKEKLWQTTGDELVDPEVCLANEAQGRIRAGDSFQSGHETTPGHPKCRCAVSFVGTDLGKIQALIDSGEL